MKDNKRRADPDARSGNKRWVLPPSPFSSCLIPFVGGQICTTREETKTAARGMLAFRWFVPKTNGIHTPSLSALSASGKQWRRNLRLLVLVLSKIPVLCRLFPYLPSSEIKEQESKVIEKGKQWGLPSIAVSCKVVLWILSLKKKRTFEEGPRPLSTASPSYAIFVNENRLRGLLLLSLFLSCLVQVTAIAQPLLRSR